MNDTGEAARNISFKYLGIGAVIILLILGIASLWLIFNQGSQQPLLPLLPTPTPPPQSIPQESQSVTFTELNDNPLTYLDQSILVTGDFLPVEKPDCRRAAGLDIRWSLTADNLQLDVLGFERIVRLLQDGTNMTVQGTWRLYQGPLGCGKAPPRGSMWYLDAKKIIRPNPLVGKGGQMIQVEIRSEQQELPLLVQTESPTGSDPIATQTLIPTSAAGTIIPTPTLTDQIIPTETPSIPGQITPSPTVPLAPTGTAPTPLPPASATDPATPSVATAVPTENPDDTTPTITAEAPPIPATSTATNNGGGYPGPEGTPTATPTPNPYP